MLEGLKANAIRLDLANVVSRITIDYVVKDIALVSQTDKASLDSFIEERGLPRVDLIKIDVEGYELHVLQGARETLARLRPVMFIEVSNFNLCEQGTSAQELIAFLEAAGYLLEDAETRRSVCSTDDLGDCFFDVICHPA